MHREAIVRNSLALLVALTLQTTSPALAQKSVSPAIVQIDSTCNTASQGGTGFVVKLEGEWAYVVTAAHVVEGCEEIEMSFSSEPSRNAEVTNMDVQIDLALLRVHGPPKTKPLLISEREIKAGATATVVGFPRRSTIPVFASVDISGRDGANLAITGLTASGSSGSPVLIGHTVVGLVTSIEKFYPRALPGVTLRRTIESWIHGELPLPEDHPGRQIKVVIVDLEGIAIPGIQISLEGTLSEASSDSGFTELQLDPRAHAGTALRLGLPASTAQDWVLTNEQVFVPSEGELEIARVVVMRRDIVRQIVARSLNRLGQKQWLGQPKEQRLVIASYAEEEGLSAEEFSEAIQSFGETDDAFDQGMVKLINGAYLEAEELFTESLEDAENADLAADSAQYLALALRLAHQFKASVEAYRRADQYRPNDPETLSGLGSAHYENGDFQAAVTAFQEAARLYSKQKGPEHKDSLAALSGISSSLAKAGELEAAKELNDSTLAMKVQVLGAEHPETLISMSNLALIYHGLGDFDGAKRLYEKTIEIRRRKLGDEHTDTLISINNLAETLRASGDLDGARQLHENVLTIRKRVLGGEHPDTLTSMSNLASTLYPLGDLHGARRLFEQALESREQVLGAHHPDTLTSINNLAENLRALGDLTGTKRLHEKALERFELTLGIHHPNTLTSMNNLANTLQALGDLAGARHLQEKTLEYRRNALGPEHPDTLASMNNLASTLDDLGDFVRARRLHETALETFKRVLGPHHPTTLTSMSNLASTMTSQADFAAARLINEEVLEIREHLLGLEHPDTTISTWNLLTVLHALGDTEATLEVVSKLRWLLEREENTIPSASQRAIRGLLLGLLFESRYSEP